MFDLFGATGTCCTTSTTAAGFLCRLLIRFYGSFLGFLSFFNLFLFLGSFLLVSAHGATFAASATLSCFLLRGAPGTRFTSSTTCSLDAGWNSGHACNEAGYTHPCQDRLEPVLLHD
jgi:hypothetical protein